MFIKVKKVRENTTLPVYKTPLSSGMDLASAVWATIYPEETIKIPTGISISIPTGYEGQVRSRSGCSLDGLIVLNSPGTIDADYTGEIILIVRNISNRAFNIDPGYRIAQLVIAPVVHNVELIEVEKLDETSRGPKGLGSTGI
jgi:dUTP pyrophosphatase